MGLAWKPAAQEMTVKLQGLAMGRKREAEFRARHARPATEYRQKNGPASPLRAAELSPLPAKLLSGKVTKDMRIPRMRSTTDVTGSVAHPFVHACKSAVLGSRKGRNQEVRRFGRVDPRGINTAEFPILRNVASNTYRDAIATGLCPLWPDACRVARTVRE